MGNCMYNTHVIAEAHIVEHCDAHIIVVQNEESNEINESVVVNIASEVLESNNDLEDENQRKPFFEKIIQYTMEAFTIEKWQKKREFYRRSKNSLNKSSLFRHRLIKIYYNFMICFHNKYFRLIFHSLKLIILSPTILIGGICMQVLFVLYQGIALSVVILFNAIGICIRPFTFLIERCTNYRFPSFTISRHLIREPNTGRPCPNDVRLNIFRVENLFEPIIVESISDIETIVSIEK